MSSEGSISQWILGLKRGDEKAAQKLWEGYFDKLVRLAHKKMSGMSRRVSDEEDLALSVLKSVCIGARKGRFPLLADRDNLWRLLVVITARKATDQYHRQKREQKLVHEWELLDEVIAQEPSPEFAAQVAEEYQRRLDGLRDETLREVAVSKMEGCSYEEIAEKLGCSRTTVARKLRLIRKTWSTGKST